MLMASRQAPLPSYSQFEYKKQNKLCFGGTKKKKSFLACRLRSVASFVCHVCPYHQHIGGRHNQNWSSLVEVEVSGGVSLASATF